MKRQLFLIKGSKVNLREIQREDLETLWELRYSDPNPEWKKWDAPYFPHETMEKQAYVEKAVKSISKQGHPFNQLIIEVDNQIIGTVIYYWENELTRWLEIGITIYLPAYWGGGYGTDAIKLYIDYLFSSIPTIERVGYTTWSGNERMIKVGEKLGMSLEGRMRKCRYFNGVYYDSIRMGILRDEWEGYRNPE